MTDSLRLMIFDRTCRGRSALVGLSHAWSVGGRLYAGAGRLDGHHGVASWEEALTWLAGHRPLLPISEIQFWGHGKWGHARVGAQVLDRAALVTGHPLHGALRGVQERLTDDALWWFRTCETFGAQAGRDFAMAWTDFFGGRAAGHTYVIGGWQSGLHGLVAGSAPRWDVREGLSRGTPEAPLRAHDSRPWFPHTISCLTGQVPPAYFD